MKEDETNPGFTDEQFSYIEKEFYTSEALKSVSKASEVWRSKTKKSKLRKRTNTSYRRTHLLNKTLRNPISLDNEFFLIQKCHQNT